MKTVLPSRVISMVTAAALAASLLVLVPAPALAQTEPDCPALVEPKSARWTGTTGPSGARAATRG